MNIFKLIKKEKNNRGINWYRTNTKAGAQMACMFGIEAPCDESRMCESVQAGDSVEQQREQNIDN